MKSWLTVFSGLLLLWSIPAKSQEENHNPWKPLEFLIGTWTQNTAQASITHTYEWVLDKQFIKSQTDARFHPEDGKASTHQDLGYFSYDKERGDIIFRQFHSEGFVNTYVLDREQTTDTLIVFVTEETENAGGMRAKLTIHKRSADQYEMILYLAGVGEAFKACQWITANRKA